MRQIEKARQLASLPDWLTNDQWDQVTLTGHFWLSVEDFNRALEKAREQGLREAAAMVKEAHSEVFRAHQYATAEVLFTLNGDILKKAGDFDG